MLSGCALQPSGLQVVVLRGYEHVERVRRNLYFFQRLPCAFRNRRLQQSRLGKVIHNKSPRLLIRKIWRQAAQQIAPIGCITRQCALACGQQCHGADLGKKAMQRVALVGPEGRQAFDFIGNQKGE
ncbi:hypothetical protein C6Y62_13070 [Hyphomicrobium sulfonivorans]|nr:hypothetical protein [Hyphomicrobium sulfonivorans]